MTKNKIRMTECISMSGKLAVCILLGTLLLLGVYSLPTGRMRENVARSSSIFDYEGTYPQMVTVINICSWIIIRIVLCWEQPFMTVRRVLWIRL